MKKACQAISVLLAGLQLALCAFAADGGDAMLGTWLTAGGQSRIEVSKCESKYCGVIVWMKNPKNDEKNADASMRGRPLVGAQILSGFSADGTGGKIYAPERGRMVPAKLVLTNPDTLEIRVAAGMIKKTVAWSRVK
jgi:uncharacterized protein (DUF2147 family)